MAIEPNRLAMLLAKAREAKAPAPLAQAIQATLPPAPQESPETKHIQFQGAITYNSKQQEFIDLVLQGKSCVLIGAAGTGKTTCTKGAVAALLQRGLPPMDWDSESEHKHLVKGPGVVATSYTRRAVQNIARALKSVLFYNCITMHKLLEYAPVVYTIEGEDGETRNTMRFEPTRSFLNPLPPQLKVIFLDESSMISKELFRELTDAITNPSAQYIFLGDINQLPPVFGDAILIHKMLELPIVELTEVYRQALDSPIITLATQIKEGKQQTFKETTHFYSPNKDSKVTIHPWKKRLHSDNAVLVFGNFITAAIDTGAYDPEEDIILCPYNEAFGCKEINKNIANHLARKRGADTYEIIAGFIAHYYSEGDRILYDKEDAIVTKIEKNPDYFGRAYQSHSKTLNYWGIDTVARPLEGGDMDIDELLAGMSFDGDDSEERKRAASHIMTVKLLNSDREVRITTASQFNTCLLAYALTVHKSQGSEWRKVFLVLHQSHNKMISRELLYTAVTRAREELYVICEPEHFASGVAAQRIKGTTLAEKIEWFKDNLIKKGLSND